MIWIQCDQCLFGFNAGLIKKFYRTKILQSSTKSKLSYSVSKSSVDPLLPLLYLKIFVKKTHHNNLQNQQFFFFLLFNFQKCLILQIQQQIKWILHFSLKFFLIFLFHLKIKNALYVSR